jgi:hypothetical protein
MLLHLLITVHRVVYPVSESTTPVEQFIDYELQWDHHGNGGK